MTKMKDFGKSAGKGTILFNLLRIIVVLGWIAFFFYNLYIVKLLGQDYTNDPSDFIFFESEQQRIAYENTFILATPGWVEEASLVSDCKPMVYFNDFYFKRIDPFVRWAAILILLTLIIRVTPEEWKRILNKIQKIEEKMED